MNIEETKALYKAFIEKFGILDAIDKCIEEMEELREELRPLLLTPNNLVLDNLEKQKIAEEAAHVICTVNKMLIGLEIFDVAADKLQDTLKHLEGLLDNYEDEQKRWEERKKNLSY